MARTTATPTCQNCNSFVTEGYIRMFAPEGMDAPRVCPHCEDLVQGGSQVQEAGAT